jgi:hypothetical protein
MGAGGSFPEVKWLGCEAEHSAPSSDEVKNGTAIPVLLNMSSWRRFQLIKHRGGFTVTLINIHIGTLLQILLLRIFA